MASDTLTALPPPVPEFLPGSRGQIFVLRYPAATTARWLLLLPPFAEELNRARRMLSLQARRLQALGFGVLIPDLFGTGDSAGDFGAARFEIWRDDVQTLIDQLQSAGAQDVTLWALRAGALLAGAVLAAGGTGISRLLLWQPQFQGKLVLNQFLRMRTVASAMEGGGQKETGRMLMDKLAAGESLEVAGYLLAPELATALGTARLTELPDSVRSILCFEVGAAEGGSSPAAERVLATWREEGRNVSAAMLAGEPFWNTIEISTAPALLDATEAALLNAD